MEARATITNSNNNNTNNNHNNTTNNNNTMDGPSVAPFWEVPRECMSKWQTCTNNTTSVAPKAR